MSYVKPDIIPEHEALLVKLNKEVCRGDSSSFSPLVFRFFDMMFQRHQIFFRKELSYSKPWIDEEDSPFLNYRFCNVYRELDKVTIWIRKNIREEHSDSPYLWFLLAAARQINWPDTLAELLTSEHALPNKRNNYSFAPETMRDIMQKRMKANKKVYTGAYIISSGRKSSNQPLDKAFYTTHCVLKPLWDDRQKLSEFFESCNSLEEAHQIFLPYLGWGGNGFMAYETVTDMRWSRYLRNAVDLNHWANPGPGAYRGLNRIFGREVDKKIKKFEAIEEMRKLLELSRSIWPNQKSCKSNLLSLYWPDVSSNWPALEMRDIEHSLCEFDKFYRVKQNEGRPRSRYPGNFDVAV